MSNPDDYWVNNPLITPINKIVMYDSDIYDAVIGERERIIKLLEEHPICVDVDGTVYCGHADCQTDHGWKTHTIALIKGENNGTE